MGRSRRFPVPKIGAKDVSSCATLDDPAGQVHTKLLRDAHGNAFRSFSDSAQGVDLIPRRTVVAYMGTTIGLPSIAGCAIQGTVPPETSAFADQQGADKWMRTWIADSKATPISGNETPSGPLYVGRFADPVYFIIQEIGWDPSAQQSGFNPVRVPVGFVTDFASIPRVFWSALRPDGLYAYAAVIHDYLYWEQFFTRAQSDSILKACMEDFKIDAATVWAVYNGVRLGGESAWSENSSKKANGEKRTLKVFPTDPTVRWDEWKQRPNVFT